jgi:prophage tail gpP-like protein
MADFTEGPDGQIDDRVRLSLGEDTAVDIFESYDVACSVLTQPAAFTVALATGNPKRVPEIIKRYQPNTTFKLSIGNVPQQMGRIDRVSVKSGVNGTSINISGRDLLAPLHDTYIEDEKSYADATYASLVRAFLAEVGLDKQILLASNAANRKMTTGAPVISRSEPTEDVTTEDIVDLVLQDTGAGGNGTAVVHRTLRARLGLRRYEFLKKELDKAGLFLWCTARGDFVLSAPNPRQEPAYYIYRHVGLSSSVIDAEFTNDTTSRYTECIVIGRGPGKKRGRSKALGQAVDPEMKSYGFVRPLTKREKSVADHRQADTIALRKLAEGRRRGWKLAYTVAGHSTPAIGGGRAVWAPDTVVTVHDELFGVFGNFWISDVRHTRGPDGSRSHINLVRLTDLLFGSDET